MTPRFLPFAFVELVSPYNKKNITRWLEDMNFMFSWPEQYFTRSLRSLVRYCSFHSNIKFISSRHRVISSIYDIRNKDKLVINRVTLESTKRAFFMKGQIFLIILYESSSSLFISFYMHILRFLI